MKLKQQLIINASADRIWTILAHDFATIGDWISSISHSVPDMDVEIPDGATVGGRVCTVPGFGKIRESFTAYDEKARTYTYRAQGMPFFVTTANNTWSVNSLGANQSQVSFEAELRMLPMIGWVASLPMRIQIQRILSKSVEELKYYAETGANHPRKQCQIGQMKQAAEPEQ